MVSVGPMEGEWGCMDKGGSEENGEVALGPVWGGKSPNPSWTPSDTTQEGKGRECFTSIR